MVGSAVVATSGLGSATSRQLNFTISRQFGSQGTVIVSILMYYDQVKSKCQDVNYNLHKLP